MTSKWLARLGGARDKAKVSQSGPAQANPYQLAATPEGAREHLAMVKFAVWFAGEAIGAGLLPESEVLDRDNGGRPPTRLYGWWAYRVGGGQALDGRASGADVFVTNDGRLFKRAPTGTGRLRPCQYPFDPGSPAGLTSSAVQEALLQRLAGRGSRPGIV